MQSDPQCVTCYCARSGRGNFDTLADSPDDTDANTGQKSQEDYGAKERWEKTGNVFERDTKSKDLKEGCSI